MIGIDRYRSWRGLSNAVSDASGARALFQQLGFVEVTSPLFDERATGHAIRALVTDELSTLGHDDSLVVFFAGHGGTRTQYVGDREVKTGYLIPSDGASDRFATWIGLEDWLYRISLLPPRHILVVLDACHSGIALSPTMQWRDGGPAQHLPLATLQARRSRVVITSALDSEVAMDSGPVHGHSLFTGCLIQGLRGGLVGDLLHDSRWVTTGTRIGLYLQNRVLSFPEQERRGGRQTPDVGRFDFDDRGEMVIPLMLEEQWAPSQVVTAPPPVIATPPPVISASPVVISAPPPTHSSSRPHPHPAPAAAPATGMSHWHTISGQVADVLEAMVSNAPAHPRHDGHLAAGQHAEVASVGGVQQRKVLGIPVARLRDPGLQKKILFLACVALVASVMVPVSLDPLVFPWEGGGFAGFLWPIISGAAYLLLTAVPANLRARLPRMFLQWIPIGVASAGIFISRMGFGSLVDGMAAAAAAAVAGGGKLAGFETVVAMLYGISNLYITGYSLLVFGLLSWIAQPQDRIPRIVIAVGGACMIPSFLDTLHVFRLIGHLPIIAIVASLLSFLIQTLGVCCIGFAAWPDRLSSRLQTADVQGRLIATALIVWIPVQQILIALSGIVHGHVLIGSLLTLCHGLLPILACFGVLTMASLVAHEEAKVIFARRGEPPGGGYSGGGYPLQGGGYAPQGGGYPRQQGGYPGQGGGYPPQQGGWQ